MIGGAPEYPHIIDGQLGTIACLAVCAFIRVCLDQSNDTRRKHVHCDARIEGVFMVSFKPSFEPANEDWCRICLYSEFTS